VTFLRKVVRRQLPVSVHAYDMTSRITVIGLLPNGWDVHGKTGTGSPVRGDGTLDEGHSFGWFVGWATNGNRTLVFARSVQDEKAESTNAGIRARAAFMYELPALLDALSSDRP
jgi:beta-lactamase class D